MRRHKKHSLAWRIVRIAAGLILFASGAALGFVPFIAGTPLGLAGLLLLAPECRAARWLKVRMERRLPALRRRLKAWGLC